MKEQEQNVENWQEELAEKILRNLAKKGILASWAEGCRFYERQFGLSFGYSAPEQWLELPGGATALDEEKGKIFIYLNPALGVSPPDYQLCVVLEEAIHYYQWKCRKRNELVPDIEREKKAKEKILQIADYLRLSAERRGFLRNLEWYKRGWVGDDGH